MLLYDIVDFRKTSFDIKEKVPRSAMQYAGSQRNGTPYANSISDNSADVKKKFSLQPLEDENELLKNLRKFF